MDCFWKLLHAKDHTLSVFENSKNVASSSGRGGMRELWSSALLTPRFEPGYCIPEPPLSYWRNSISKWYDGILEVSDLGHAAREILWLNGVFKAGKSTFKTEVCSKLADVQLTTQWIKEVEIAKCTDERMTSRATIGRTAFSRLRYA